jgi:fatty-acyl-CoA synthase
LLTGVRRAPDQQIVYADKRLTYREFEERVARLGSALAALGVRHGHTVAVMDWDTNRYLECFFAVPMMGAVLHTVNVRLSPEQVLYTINHAPDDMILVNGEFLPLLDEIWERVVPGKTLVLMSDSDADVTTSLPLAGEYEALLAAADPDYEFPALDENTRATTFYTTGTTGLPKGVSSATASSSCTPSPPPTRSAEPVTVASTKTTSTSRSRPCSTCIHGASRISRPCAA